jgi:hypothetical protein
MLFFNSFRGSDPANKRAPHILPTACSSSHCFQSRAQVSQPYVVTSLPYPDMGSKLCDYCKGDQGYENRSKGRSTEVESGQTNESNARVLGSGSLLDLLRRPGCSFCELVLHQFSGLDGDLSTRSESELLPWTYDIILSKHTVRIIWQADTHSRADQTIEFSFSPYSLGGNSIEEILGTEQIDTERLVQRIDYCQSQHEHCKRQRRKSQYGYPKRVIDVKSWSLVRPTGPIEYCALSYVWGNVKTLEATISTVHSLEESRGLERQKSNIPLVIQDAILLTSTLGCQYLWVDALCILQDDHAELAAEISRMGSIYSQAFLTIAAASGNDADSCLPGLRPGTRPRPRTLTFIDGDPVVVQPSDEIFDNVVDTKYESRAWTFQETRLSPRCLYFCEDTFFLRCLEYVYMELEPDQPTWSDPNELYIKRLGTYLMRPMDCPMPRRLNPSSES